MSSSQSSAAQARFVRASEPACMSQTVSGRDWDLAGGTPSTPKQHPDVVAASISGGVGFHTNGADMSTSGDDNGGRRKMTVKLGRGQIKVGTGQEKVYMGGRSGGDGGLLAQISQPRIQFNRLKMLAHTIILRHLHPQLHVI